MQTSTGLRPPRNDKPSAAGEPTAAEIARRAAQCIAGGAVSLNRKVEPELLFVRAAGSRLFDADGRQYIDYHAAFAPHLLGHNHPVINGAVREAMERQWSLMGSGTTPWEVRLAELLCAAVPSLETVQIANTGSEATAHAVRLSRAWTGRNHIILTLGGYNGWHNEVARAVSPSLEQVGPRVSPGEYRFIPLSAGIPESTRSLVHLVNFNDLASVEYVMRRYPVACVMTEPVLQNIGVVPPREGYLQGLRDLCDEHGALLVFDEVKTGFRSALGGFQSICGVLPDLSLFGKAVANGFPLGVIGGRRDVMSLFGDPDPARRVLIAGTYNAHPFTSAAAIATIEYLRDQPVYAQLEALGARMQAGLERIFAEHGITATVSRIGSAFCVYFCDHVPVDYHDLLLHHDFTFDMRYRRELIDRGIYHFPIACKQSSISAAHTIEDIDQTLEITRDVLREI
ncbi:MAG TPA: aspartate aminotransferase family protein [Candidatus Sumerlaeota bacterium]|nr:aspartate aminotransferase family protein [Candidatus Sumerlaeota bacterium]HOR29325.1 aspartate aminotransferase family protein [Candidatus Sumerlaeota bacterium]HPK01201.1 aspartate aminotransferase family protein [Candidatus Sumerlaeota bacterium]